GLGQSALIALSPQGEAPLPLPDALVFLMPALQALCRALKAVFDFALDMEWAWDHQARQVVLLQVRPQTHAVGPLLPLPTGVPVVREAGNWRYTALSESLGRLSPLSFSLLQHLYQALIPDLRALGYRAGAVDFLQRLPDGAVLVDSGREQAFYAPTRLGGFWKGFRAPALRQQALNTLHNWHREAGFSAETLAALFRVWMVANLLAAGAGRATSLPPHAYELSWLAGTPDSTLPLPVLQPDWPGINTRAQQLFLYELEKLKCELARYPEQVFCHWGEFVCAEVVDQAGLHERQRVQVRQALYDHVTPVLADGALRDSRFVALAALSVAEGPALVVANPASQPAVFPTGSILLAPYFDNRWVGAMTGLHGVVVRQGSRLSHSAIVAREQGIPYCVMPGLDLQAFASGRLLRLDAIRQTLTTAAVRELN
ncbi:MAG: hypothetical protein KDI15_05445, partial [Thiothrix sp.]|nr:hypothetical protein [Thiothrix sp.]